MLLKLGVVRFVAVCVIGTISLNGWFIHVIVSSFMEFRRVILQLIVIRYSKIKIMNSKLIEIVNEAIELYEDILQYAEFRLSKNDRITLLKKIQRISEIRDRIKNS